ncbi:hypothetical protein C1645_864167 [Glomus cerebriforme]|uniref:Protein kinase domain-containing protein n=1 Tax=Glomus cerebriforme TaxID=658196 RepID=A0A397SBR5_9GLOM|nr:hypothetical protein C1645_864167 [Glomus cerebriforme]
MTSLKEWIDMRIKDGNFDYFEYKNFSDIEKISTGGFGVVKRAIWIDGGIKVALKSLLNNSIDDQNENFLRELKLLRQCNHPNINRFLGVTKVVNGVRETPIENTPFEYQQLYENCWEKEPNQRPDIVKVYRILMQLKSKLNNNEQIKVKTIQNFDDLNNTNSGSSTAETSYGDSNIENLYFQNEIREGIENYEHVKVNDFNTTSVPGILEISTENLMTFTNTLAEKNFEIIHTSTNITYISGAYALVFVSLGSMSLSNTLPPESQTLSPISNYNNIISDIRRGLIFATIHRAYTLIDYNIHNNIYKQYKFMQQKILADKSFIKHEKIEAIRFINKNFNRDKILYNSGTKRVCENCNQECLATLYCEYCVRNYLKENFSNWTSGNNDIDNYKNVK